MQSDYMQITYINNTKEFWKDIQITFIKNRDCINMQDKRNYELGKKVKNKKILRVKCKILFNSRLKDIKNVMDSLIYFFFNILYLDS